MKKIKAIILTLSLIFTGALMLVSCDEVKQIISDVAAPEIEQRVNEALGFQNLPAEEQFELPEATRYEDFKILEEGNKTTYSGTVVEPKVTFEDYAKELSDKLGADFTTEEINQGVEEIRSEQEWTYVDEDGTSYKFNFKELVKEDGSIDSWTVDVVIIKPEAEAE